MKQEPAFGLNRPWLIVFLAAALMVPLRALGAATTVREPAWGLPHIYADTDLELARENGRQVAKDRLGQIILLGRVGRGTLAQAFGVLDSSILNDDIEARLTQYTSSELNKMYDVLPQRLRDLIFEYCKGVNDVIDEVYAGTSPEPIEVTLLRNTLGLADDLFGNATNISDQVDPFYLAPGGADPSRPNGGFQFTPEMFVSIAILQVRNFGFENFNESSRLDELQALVDKHGSTIGTEIWRDLNFLNDPLAPISVPDPTAPGFGGPLSANALPAEIVVAQGPMCQQRTGAGDWAALEQERKVRDGAAPIVLAAAPVTAAEDSLGEAAEHWPAYSYADAAKQREQRLAMRADRARQLGAWPALGSYSWIIAANKSATGNPWLGGFPQTGIQTPSVMHFMENRSAEEVQTVGMEFAGAPAVLIGQTDTVAWTSTTAQLRVVDTFFEEIVNEEVDAVRYDAEGTPAPLSKRTETFHVSLAPDTTVVMWRSHETNGNGGTRPVVDFLGDETGTAESGTATTLEDTDKSFSGSLASGYVLIIDGTGAGQIRQIASVAATTLTVNTAWTTAPDDSSVYVAAESGNVIVAEALDSAGYFEESTSALGFSLLQESTSVLDVRAAMRLVPSTHNFPSIDNQPFNGVGTDNGNGNIAYYSSGFSRIRQGGEDKLLPLDGTVPNPLAVVSGTVASTTANSLVADTSAFTGKDFTPPAMNFRYDNPTLQGSEYVVKITSGTGAWQSRRIASNTADTLTVEYDWGVDPAAGDRFEVYEIVAMPEAINPMEGYSANWNNKGATADDGRGFGRNHRVAFILERLAAENMWDREKQRQLNKDLAGINGSGNRGRYLVPRLRQAFDDACSGDATIEAVLLALEAHNDQTNCLNLGTTDDCGRDFDDPVYDTTRAGEEGFLSTLINRLADDIYGDELAGALSVPHGGSGLALVLHAIDSAAGDVPGSYTQEYSGDYFNGGSWESVVCGAMAALAGGGIPADSPRGNSTYNHPLAALFPELSFEPTPAGNRGTWEQIVEAGATVNGEFMFPLGQSGLIEGSFGGVDSIDPNADSIQPIWRDWRFLPMLHASQDLASGNPDSDGDGVWDSFERWYFGDLSRKGRDDSDGDKLRLVDEFERGADPTDADTDDDGIPDGQDPAVQNRLESGVTKLRAFVKYGKDPGTDFLKLVAKIGTGSPEFDPNTKDITLTVSDEDTIYMVTIPAGTMEEKKAGRKWLYKDKEGTLGGLFKAVVKLGKKAGKPARLKFKTTKMDLSNAQKMDHVVDVEIVFGAHTIPDSRLWTFNGKRKLKATK